ncbi:glutamate--tRNA ligase family protein [Paenibacillaceae bacterium T2]|uniref:Glutamate--tRNA ligase family protein n=1 Tax=Ferviditalea candida TaxID=3108399 RepID=A0ABU5ZQX5_9BACL|nr:glutamate--tRNA ligase family protein [Paenibacillaceae bacterium T2]
MPSSRTDHHAISTDHTRRPRSGRFAPMPSGKLHLGHAWTALLAWLQMRQCGGRFILRIEDIDDSRFVPGMAEQMMNDLKWLGLDWGEGPDIEGVQRSLSTK